ncbi:hypothetical protein RRG08_044712 [Elysia crispata]|uniref:Uncharacterized protein n=1 Tax=Elysia crispata TaxID=231223 RepID=A0AAE0XXD1_9GAST|nr:hypothetical protein RRG08_044712 [Elysia crispata]
MTASVETNGEQSCVNYDELNIIGSRSTVRVDGVASHLKPTLLIEIQSRKLRLVQIREGLAYASAWSATRPARRVPDLLAVVLFNGAKGLVFSVPSRVVRKNRSTF